MSLLLDVELGSPITRGALTLHPLLVADPPPTRGYVTGPEAGATLDLGELDSASVPELVATHTADQPLLLIEGETLVGAKQDRVLNVSVLLPAGASTTIPVSCVEAGRWGHEKAMGRSGRHAPSGLRARKTRSVKESIRRHGDRRSDQGEVWHEVAGYQTAFASASPTSSLHDVYADAVHQTDDVVQAVQPAEGQVGVVATIAGEHTVVELFDHPDTFAAYWPSLAQGYAIDAIRSRAVDAVETPSAARALERLRAVELARSPATGLGDELTLDGDGVDGLGLEWDGHIVHLAAFAAAGC